MRREVHVTMEVNNTLVHIMPASYRDVTQDHSDFNHLLPFSCLPGDCKILVFRNVSKERSNAFFITIYMVVMVT